MMKFTQCNDSKYCKNKEPKPLQEILLGTGDKYLCEASPFDRVWGIGFKAIEAKGVKRETWGENLLGQALCQVREEIREEQNTET